MNFRQRFENIFFCVAPPFSVAVSLRKLLSSSDTNSYIFDLLVQVVRSAQAGNDSKLQATLKRLQLTPLQAIDEVNMFRNDGKVLQFTNPKVQVNIQSKTYVISGKSEVKGTIETSSSAIETLSY
jgi:hypothetical protein